MCWICDRDAKKNLALDYVEGLMAQPAMHLAEARYYKSDDALLGTGHDLVPLQLNLLVLTTDTIPANTGTTVTLTVGGPAIISTLDTVGDQDWFRIELEAGKTYEIGQYLVTGGPSGVPLADAYIELYDATGNLVVSADGGGPNTPSGLDALLSFTPEVGGTYYVNARSYDQDALNGTGGDFVGDYEVFAREASPFAYKPYYEPDDPLYALDWGSQIDGSSRNPDGEEGPRPTGNEFTGHAWNPYGIEGKTVVYYYFAKQGEVYVSEDPANPGLENMVAAGFRDWEMQAYEMALGEYEKVADIVYIEVDNRNAADFIFITYDGTPDVGVLGRMSPPDEQNEGQTEFNRNGPGWNEQSLKPGGFSFQTLMHELGHGHGMSHPHDAGGRSGVLRGVVEEATFDYSTGDYNLNQGIYTIMSYEDGWRPRSEATVDTDGDGINDTEGLRPDGHGAPPTSSSYGWVGSLSAFDIAVIQDKYGVNEEWATGNDTYVLNDANVDGTFYSTIWDAAGTDEIVYAGARDATIDLRAATLEYEFGGGGRMSFALGIHGGFTIANGVTIENASGGKGHDTITGNDAANVLHGNQGNDVLDGGAGEDRLVGGIGNDTYHVDSHNDIVVETANGGTDTIVTSSSYTIRAFVENLHYTGTAGAGFTGNELDNRIQAQGALGDVIANGADGNDKIFSGAGNDTLYGGSGHDNLVAGDGNDRLNGGDGNDRLQGDAGNDVLLGHAGDDRITGGNGDDQLNGGAGADVLGGGGGADLYIFDDSSVDGSIDQITNFKSSEGDKVRLRPIDADANAAGNQDFTFVGSNAFSGAAGELRLTDDGAGNWLAEADVDGDGIADLSIFFAHPANPITVTDFIL